MDASAELKALYDRVQLAIDKAEEAKEGHDQYEREAWRADEITYDEFNTNTDAVQAAFSAFYNTARSARDQASKSATRAAELDLAARAQFFAVTDPTGMAAFWASLRESCQPYTGERLDFQVFKHLAPDGHRVPLAHPRASATRIAPERGAQSSSWVRMSPKVHTSPSALSIGPPRGAGASSPLRVAALSCSARRSWTPRQKAAYFLRFRGACL